MLCAESDEDRDSWVEMLVRYYTGTYSEDLMFDPASGLTSVHGNPSVAALHQMGQPRVSSSNETAASPAGPRTQPTSRREDISRGALVPVSQLTSVPIPDDYARSSSPSRVLESSAGDRQGPSNSGVSDVHKRMIERSGLGPPFPDSSPFTSTASLQQDNATPAVGVRANSELGDYPDLQENRGMNRSTKRQTSVDQKPREDGRKSIHPGLSPGQTPPERVPTPDRLEGKMKISGPMNGAPIPSGFKFGGKDTPSGDSPSSSNDRREKAKSRSFWGFGKGNVEVSLTFGSAFADVTPFFLSTPGEKQSQSQSTPRSVFGVPLEEALEVSQICNLPSIVFRSIQYLEFKKADQEEGIYRLSGSSAVIKALKDRFNNGS